MKLGLGQGCAEHCVPLEKTPLCVGARHRALSVDKYPIHEKLVPKVIVSNSLPAASFISTLVHFFQGGSSFGLWILSPKTA